MKARMVSRGDGRISLKIHPDDNVATILDTEEGLDRLADGSAAKPGIPFGHKVALRPIPRGAAVLKYGVVIGTAQADIAAGDHVHVHNLA